MTITTTADAIRNGVDTATLFATLDAIVADPPLGRFQFRARNEWINGSHNRVTIRDFYAAGQEDTSRAQEFRLDAGEPAILLGTDTGPNPAELLLAALSACLTTSIVYVAAARGVKLTRVESTLEGDMDVRGALGLSDEVRNGFEQIRVTFRIEGDAPEAKLQEVVEARPPALGGLRHGHERRPRHGGGRHGLRPGSRRGRLGGRPTGREGQTMIELQATTTQGSASWRSPRHLQKDWPAGRRSTTVKGRSRTRASRRSPRTGISAPPCRRCSAASA